MRYVKRPSGILRISPSKAAPWALCLSLSLFSSACSLRILGIDKNSDSLSGGTSLGESAGNENGINAFSVLGASGGSDAAADAYLTDGTTLTAEWVDTTGEDSYEVGVLDEGGNTTLCGPVGLPADTTSHTFTGCALAHGASYRIQVIAKNSQSGSSRSFQGSFQVGSFLTIGQVTADEWGIASAPVTLSYAVASPVTVQYVTVDGSAQAGTDYTQLPLTTLTFPAGQTSATLHVPISKDVSDESDEDFRIELTTPSGAAIQTSSAEVSIQDGNLPASTEFASLSSFGGHTCAITSSGGAKCWGSGTTGQLGDNTSTDRSVPTSVTGLSSGITQIASGGGHTCSLSSGGAVKCWGLNSFGQVGDNSVAIRQAPADVFGFASGISQVAVGGYHSCAVTSAGAALCWGYNGFGQVGDNTAFNRSIPTGVFNLSSGVTQITAGDNHSCALLSTGAVKCWGYNGGGQLGDNSTNSSMIPVDVVGLSSGVNQIVAGGIHTCALMGTGAVKCWGSNSTGQIGDNSTLDRVIPTDVSSLSSGVT